MNWAHSRQNSSVTQAVSRTIYVYIDKNNELDFSSTILNFFIPFGNTEVVILIYFRELLYERRIDGTSEQMSSSSRSDLRL